ncbi:MAG: hypothetical protein E7520_05800 [Ruminococcaceae bacterium]|nr:hypothetical protein [Oscillospiraceae bacterium]
MKKHIKLLSLLLVICALFSACTITFDTVGDSAPELASVQEYNEDAFCVVNDNVPQFSADEITTDSFEEYGDLDPLGRCTVCTASIGKDLMPTEKRGAIGMVKPTGWHTVKYDGIDGNYLYNRCHLIGFQLTGENANTRNLITGTRYMNTEGMLPFENEVAEYVRRTKKHVMYRVTPDFRGRELVARGVQIEAYSVEDKGRGVSFNVYCYNVQPGIEIDYATGESKKLKTATQSASSAYILNTNSKKFHRPSCKLAKDISDKNKKNYSGSREELINRGYKPCGSCKP